MSKFCSTCSTLTVSPEQLSAITDDRSILLKDIFFQDLNELIVSARGTASSRACHLCILLLWTLENAITTSNKLPSGLLQLELIPGEELSLSIRCGGMIGNPLPISFDDSDEICTAEVSLRADSDEVFGVIEYWLKGCQEHEQYVGSTSQQPKLCETSGLVSRYITLSHRWTESTSASSTTSLNFEKRKVVIEILELSQTFQDAISVTRRLGVQYLWIDSLCIIQDSPDDWTRESHHMMSIYELAWLNISAAGSDSEDGRLFMQKNPILHRPLSLPAGLWPLADPQNAEGQSTRPHGVPWGFGQESSLLNLKFNSATGAPRLDHIVEETARIYPQALPDCSYDPMYYDSWKLPIYTYWLKLVETYSAKNLTRSSDKLPAINGLAQALHKSRLPGESFDNAYYQGICKTKTRLFRMEIHDAPSPIPSTLSATKPSSKHFSSLSPSLYLTPKHLGIFFSSQSLGGNGRGLDPRWSDIGYAGAEQFWRADWHWMQDPKWSDDEYGTSRDDYWDFLVYDPTDLDFITDIVSNTPTMSSSSADAPGLIGQDPNATDVFRKLPYHVMEEVLQFLPTESVKALRLSSRTATHHSLSNQFWRSRFFYPNELSYIPLSSIPTPTFGAQINFKSLRHQILEPESQENPTFMTTEEKSHYNRNRISRIIRNFVTTLLASLSSEKGIPRLWKEEKLEGPGLAGKTISSSAELITGRDKIDFSNSFQWSQITSVTICYEQLLDGHEYPNIDGIEFHCGDFRYNGEIETKFPNRYRGRRHGESSTGGRDVFYVEMGCELVGFVATTGGEEEVQEGYVALRPISKGGDGRSDEMEVRRWVREHIGGEVVTLLVTAGATVKGLEATFLKDWMTSLTLVQKDPA
ncbi:hypothetical protein EG329_008980 [Mollisiaceae sp. DMI_Dod_QoI]|nr:hypothetical protein EG329_008980 [Helotiales sp. DMI_Dod_QoI]